MNQEFILALEEIEREKGVDKEIIFEALESALVSSYKKNFGSAQNVDVEMNRETGDVALYALKEVVENGDLTDNNLEITLSDAQAINASYQLGDTVRIRLEPENFGRIAAQTAKQVVIQRIKDAERDVIFEDYTDRENEIITGEVRRVSNRNVFFDLGKTEALLPFQEQIPGEHYGQGERFKLLLLEVRRTPKGPQVILSRSHPNLIKRLFEMEVPEILDGVVEIYSIAREAGSRTKIAVFSKDPSIDPLGACVGFKGNRVKTIVDQLYNEKIDIVIYEKDIAEFIANALSPSKVVDVFIKEREKEALVVVPDYQLSLAIGKEGQNARLAAKLTNWKIDIKSESQFEEFLEEENLTKEELRQQFAEANKADALLEDLDQEDQEDSLEEDLEDNFDLEIEDLEEDMEEEEDQTIDSEDE
ncbi:MAG: transcription termination/antitermination protein NusA [Peptoniphilus sp. oral taxon 375]|uniref:transcription termination factor NusA n=1 Tax=Urinicoccus timonensis TaxID=2024205 RepID=UPI00021A2989|nr:transcription termination factor NusA [Urinicoccus timonensis]EGS31123.1 transcription termination factor NusA [Peptoniphilus sp. oral taxon 375 str. F0436]MBS4871312.1 transcription termination/antitermination protein NusA [Peptoniphilus sp. oral taxon 375]